MPLRTHKLSPPPSRAGLIRRDAILERLCGRETFRVVLLQGPAGHGKSTTLQQISRRSAEQGSRTGWLTLDESDNDGHRFFLRLQTIAPQLGGQSPEAGVAGALLGGEGS